MLPVSGIPLVPLISSFVGVFFGTSAWSKFRDPVTFSRISRDYPLPRLVSARFVGRTIPYLELALALCLLGWPFWSVTLPTIGAILFLAAVSLGVGVRLSRGERRFPCGCTGDLTASHSALGVLGRNLLLISLLQLQVFAHHPSLPAGPVLAAYFVGVGVTLVLQLAEAARIALATRNEWKATG